MSATRFEYASLGPAEARRVVVVLREGTLASTDPDIEVTRQHDVRLVAVRVGRAEVAEPGAFGGETPAAVTVAALLGLIGDVAPDGPVGVVGVGGAGLMGVHLSAALAGRVDRFALVATPEPEAPLDRDEAERALARVAADALVLAGEEDPDAPPSAARWYRARLRSARLEIFPADGGADRRLALVDVWDRVLDHTAPDVAAQGAPA